VAPVNERGEIEMDELDRRIGARTKLVSVAHVSNALGTINPIGDIVRLAHGRGARVLVDGAQAAPHIPVDVQDLDCDFYAFSGHKAYGPTGIGILYGKAEVLDAMPPYHGGGEMILSVSFEKTTYNELPYKFEAGTPHIAGAIGLGAAVDYLSALDRAAVARYEHELLDYAESALLAIPGIRIVGTARKKAGLHSFTMDGVHPHDIGTILDHEGIAIRTGHHCAQPVMDKLAGGATARASLGIYNTRDDIDRLVEGLQHVRRVFG
jgi:cysteine desulfurase/selenocysteine lyase